MVRKIVMVLLFVPFITFAEDPPMKDFEFSDYIVKLNGRSFTKWEYAQSWCEQDGYAVYDGEIQHFWLYDTYKYHNGKSEVIYNQIVPHWIEKTGYAIDYDYYSRFTMGTGINGEMQSALKALMTQRGCDIAISAFYNDAAFWHWTVYIFEYNKVKKIYTCTFIPLIPIIKR